MSPDRVQVFGDEGQELAELEASRAQVEFDRFIAEKRAILADYTAQVRACPKADRLDMELRLSVEFMAWYKANEVPCPARQGPFKPLALVGRGYLPGPMTNG